MGTSSPHFLWAHLLFSLLNLDSTLYHFNHILTSILNFLVYCLSILTPGKIPILADSILHFHPGCTAWEDHVTGHISSGPTMPPPCPISLVYVSIPIEGIQISIFSKALKSLSVSRWVCFQLYRKFRNHKIYFSCQTKNTSESITISCSL